jgi:tripartite-type tricarboxylate transporter receptor subunit TctC
MKTTKKIVGVVMALLIVTTGTLFAGAAQQQGGVQAVDNYPTKPIRIIFGNAPGGALETSIRMWQPYFEKEIGQPLVIDSLPGADGIVCGRTLINSEADGYTFSVASLISYTAHELVLEAPYKAADFELQCTYIWDPLVFMVHKDSQWKTMKDVIDYAKNQPPGTFSIGCSDLTTIDNIILHMIEEKEGIKWNIIPFQGGNPARMALAGRHIDGMVPSFFAGQSIWEYCRVLAVGQDENKWKDITDNAPTFTEAMGYYLPPIADTISLYAPKGFAEKYPERQQKFFDALFKDFQNTDFQANLEKTGQKGRFRTMTQAESMQAYEDLNKLYKDNLRFVSRK